jgi:hypothetical protein
MDMGNVAEWFGAGSTLLAVVVALGIALRDGYLKRRSETRRQAESISAWPVYFGAFKKKDLIYISNSSRLPIYDVLISYGVAYGAGQAYSSGDEYQTAVLRVPPGDYFVKAPKNHGGGMHVQHGISISFRDINGIYWRRDARGVLTQTGLDPFNEMGVSQPIGSWELLDPITPIERP